MVELEFRDGTLIINGSEEEIEILGSHCVRDDRIDAWRAEARHYADFVLALHHRQIPYEDRARDFAPLELQHDSPYPPRDYQQEALDAWRAARCGVVVLPTGSGKSFVARLIIAAVNRPTLVVVPTLDLMAQWANQLEQAFHQEIGLLGGGSREFRDITVSTYDSAVLNMEFHGNRFGLLIVDECHHLPGPGYQTLAKMMIAPFRLGLTATPERDDDGENALFDLLGPICYRKEIDELEGDVLASYTTIPIEIELDPDEFDAYTENREIYINFIRANAINFSNPGGWAQFLMLCARSEAGKKAFKAYLAQKRIARSGRAKFRKLWELFRAHSGERILVFTADNDTAYAIGEKFFLPVITHRTKITERREFLTAFREGRYPILVTSKVLNEGVDVPEASVGIVVSGSGSIREHVQRLGRILRPSGDKHAVLYELISGGTSESYVSERRRQHRAYQSRLPKSAENN